MAPWNVGVGFRRHEYGIALSGLHARFQIAKPQPTFYLREPHSVSGWQLLRLTPRKDYRELRVISAASFFVKIDFRTSQFREIELKAIAADVFTVRPTAALDPSEYLLCTEIGRAHV